MDVPSGTVILWLGSAANIPAGWTKYSATVGRFIRGVPYGQSVGATGGNASTHVHAMGTALTGGSHSHGSVNFTYSSSSKSSFRIHNIYGAGGLSPGHSHTASVSLGDGGAHVHNPASANTGAPIGETNPPYVKGIYIIKT